MHCFSGDRLDTPLLDVFGELPAMAAAAAAAAHAA